MVCSFLERFLNKNFDHARYGLKPKHRCLSAHVTMNDTLPNKILCGTVKVRGDIDRFVENGVIFKGDNGKVTRCDTVILGTGYQTRIPFLSESILPISHNKVRLFKHMFLPDIPHPKTLGIIGLFQTLGAGIPAVELQCRWYALLNAGKCKLPSRKMMEKDIDRKKREIEVRYYESDRHTFQADWLPFLDEIASEIKCAPPLLKYVFCDPKLWYCLMFGVSVPYQFRLVGPNKWANAREAILTAKDRIEAPFSTGK